MSSCVAPAIPVSPCSSDATGNQKWVPSSCRHVVVYRASDARVAVPERGRLGSAYRRRAVERSCNRDSECHFAVATRCDVTAVVCLLEERAARITEQQLTLQPDRHGPVGEERVVEFLQRVIGADLGFVVLAQLHDHQLAG